MVASSAYEQTLAEMITEHMKIFGEGSAVDKLLYLTCTFSSVTPCITAGTIFQGILRFVALTLGVPLTDVDIDAEILDTETMASLRKYDLRAPVRLGLENVTINAPDSEAFGCGKPVNHTNITSCYTNSKILNLGVPDYILDNFVGLSNP